MTGTVLARCVTGATMAEKVLARTSGKDRVAPGDVVVAKVDLAMSHDNAALIANTFRRLPVKTVWDTSRMVQVLDHRSPAPDVDTATKHQAVRAFVKEQKVGAFYDVGEGICHQVLFEKGHVRPGAHIVGTDSHTCIYGALGAFAYGVGATEMAAVWASGELWAKVPETMRVRLDGKMAPGVFAKDVTLRVVGDVGADGAAGASVEFSGSAVDAMSIESRMTLCNMGVEMDAVASMCATDAKALAWLAERGVDAPAFGPDAGSRAAEERALDVSRLEPQVACPHRVDNVHPVSAVVGKTVHQAFLGSCVNGRLEDFREAARVLKGRKVHPDTRFIVTPASRDVMLAAMKDGTLATLVEAGAVVGTPGCGPCMGAAGGLLAAGETCIASSNRNFKGRMGSPDSNVYLASPATVAASAVKGEIADPRTFL